MQHQQHQAVQSAVALRPTALPSARGGGCLQACGPGGSIAAAVASALERSLRPAIASTEFQEDLAHAFQQAFARAANADRAAAGELHLPLMPLPLYDGTYPAWFPETIAELDTMSGAQLEAIMMEYDLPVPPAFADRRAAFRAFWGLPPS